MRHSLVIFLTLSLLLWPITASAQREVRIPLHHGCGELVYTRDAGWIHQDDTTGTLHFPRRYSFDGGLGHTLEEVIEYDADSLVLRRWRIHQMIGGISVEQEPRVVHSYTLNLAPVPIPYTGERVKFFASYGDYRTLDDRFMDGTLVHRTSLGLDIKITERLDFHGVLDHFALWGGKSDKLEMPVTLGNYFRVITASEASENGTRSDQINVIGDQRGRLRVDILRPYDRQSSNCPEGDICRDVDWQGSRPWGRE